MLGRKNQVARRKAASLIRLPVNRLKEMSVAISDPSTKDKFKTFSGNLK